MYVWLLFVGFDEGYDIHIGFVFSHDTSYMHCHWY